MSLIELTFDIKVKRNEARREYKSHFATAGEYRTKHHVFGMLAILFSLVAGSAFMAKLSSHFYILNWIPPLFTIFSAIFCALITFNKYLEKAQQHYQLAGRWEEYKDNCSEVLYMIHNETSRESSNDICPDVLKSYQSLISKRKKIRQNEIGYPKKYFRKFENIKDKLEIESPPACVHQRKI